MILYLHGFRSSPQSFKAKLIGERLRAIGLGHRYVCPQLPVSPQQTIALANDYIARHRREQRDPKAELVLIGSSLGGFYATWLAEEHGCRAIVLNPAIHPWTDLHRYLGEQPLYHGGGSIVVEPHHLAELQALAVPAITRADRYFLMAATGDEVLDYREMLAHYPGAYTQVIQGSDHSISVFPNYLDDVLAFCNVVPACTSVETAEGKIVTPAQRPV